MPIFFPSLGKDGKPDNVRYWSVDEAAPKLHVGRMTLREKCRRNQWPHLRVTGRYFLSDEHLARIVEMNTVNPDLPGPDDFPPPPGSRPRLVIDDDPDEAEGGVK
jgi:hypothetical protein